MKTVFQPLVGLSVIRQVMGQECSRFKLFWSSSFSRTSVTVLNTLRSSAYKRQLEFNCSGMSLMKAKNRLGPRIEPSGTPLTYMINVEVLVTMTENTVKGNKE